MIKLEVGEKYNDRDGREYDCVYWNDMRVGTYDEFTVRNAEGTLIGRSADGRVRAGDIDNRYDLIAEVVPGEGL